MLKSILVGLDGSAYGESAVSLGLRWAKQFSARLAGATVIDEPGITADEPVPMGAAYFKGERQEQAIGHARTKAAGLLQQFTQRCTAEGVTSTALQLVGDPPEVIQAEAQKHDLIMLGIETYFRFETQNTPCNTLDHVLHSPPRPVVAVPETLVEGQPVVIGYDGSVQAARTLMAYLATGLAQKCENVVITIDEDQEEADRLARVAADFLTLHGAAVKVRALETRIDPGPTLLEHTVQLKAQLLVMGAFGHSMLREFVFGSTTRTVLRGSKVPVMLFH